MPSRDAQVRALVSAGIMPADAEEILDQAEARLHQPLTEIEATALAGVTEDDIAQTRLWWYYNPAVSAHLKRILDAAPIQPDTMPDTATEPPL